MAQAAKKKIVVCGGNGFLGVSHYALAWESDADGGNKEAEYAKLLFRGDGMSHR